MKQLIWIVIIGLSLALCGLIAYGFVNVVLWSLTVLNPTEIIIIVGVLIIIFFCVNYNES